MVNKNSKKSSTSKTGKTTSSSQTTTSSTSSTSTSKSTMEKSGSKTTSSQSGVVISEITDMNRGETSVANINPGSYVVTHPDQFSPARGKERYIFGGTQIVEVDSTSGGKSSSEFIEHESQVKHKKSRNPFKSSKETITTESSSTKVFVTEPIMLGTTDVENVSRITQDNSNSTLGRIVEETVDKKSDTGIKASPNHPRNGRPEKIVQESHVQRQSGNTDRFDSTSTSTERTQFLSKIESSDNARTQTSNSRTSENKTVEELQKTVTSNRNKGNWDGTFTYEETTASQPIQALPLNDSSVTKHHEESFYSAKQTSGNDTSEQANMSSRTTETVDGEVKFNENISKQWGTTGKDKRRNITDSTSSKLETAEFIRQQQQELENNLRLLTDSETNVKTTEFLSETDSKSRSNVNQRNQTTEEFMHISETGSDVKSSDRTTQRNTSDWNGQFLYENVPAPKKPKSWDVVDKSKIQDVSSLVVNDRSDVVSSEQYSQSSTSVSKSEKTSASSKVIEIIDGKERVVEETSKEWGSQQAQDSEQLYHSKSGPGIVPKAEFSQKTTEELIHFKKDSPNAQPIHDRKYRDTQRNVKLVGDSAPVEHSTVTEEITRFDEKTGKYITDVRHKQDNRDLSTDKRITDFIDTKQITSTDRTQLQQLTDVQDTNTSKTTKTETETFFGVVNTPSAPSYKDNITDTTTTYTSKTFDDKTNTWQVVDESTVNEKSVLKSEKPSKPLSPVKKPKDVKPGGPTTSKSVSTTEELLVTTSTANTQDKSTVSQQLYDEKTKSWREVDEQTIKTKRPSLIRYVSKDKEGKYTTIYKKKIFDKRTGTWKVVDEKIYRNNLFNEHIPEVIDDVTNVTTTTYTTKVFDNKTNTWKIVDEKSFTDSSTLVPKDIAAEIEKDQPNVANITTTTEITKVIYDFMS